MEDCICLATVIVKDWTDNPNWAYAMEGHFALISGKDIPALSCEAQGYIKTEDSIIILLPFESKYTKISQEMVKDKMSFNDMVWIVKQLDFLVMGSNKFNFV